MNDDYENVEKYFTAPKKWDKNVYYNKTITLVIAEKSDLELLARLNGMEAKPFIEHLVSVALNENKDRLDKIKEIRNAKTSKSVS